MASIPRQSELDRWLGEHDKTQSVSLREWIFACQQRTGHNQLVQLFVYDNIGGDRGILKTNLRPATHEVARHKGIIGDWSVQITDQLLEATIVFADGTLAKAVLLKTGDETMSQRTLTKEEVISRIESEMDSVPDLLAWTRNQPQSRVPATYNMKGGVWGEMMAFRDDRLKHLPEVVSLDSIQYLMQSDDKKDWMLCQIILRKLFYSDPTGIWDPAPKHWILTNFRSQQSLKQEKSGDRS